MSSPAQSARATFAACANGQAAGGSPPGSETAQSVHASLEETGSTSEEADQSDSSGEADSALAVMLKLLEVQLDQVDATTAHARTTLDGTRERTGARPAVQDTRRGIQQSTPEL